MSERSGIIDSLGQDLRSDRIEDAAWARNENGLLAIQHVRQRVAPRADGVQ